MGPSQQLSKVDLKVKRSLLRELRGDLTVELDLGCAPGDTLLVHLSRQGGAWVALLAQCRR